MSAAAPTNVSCPVGVPPSQVVILFTAHSLPMKVVEKGDAYVHEVAATARAVMESMPPGVHNSSLLAWQSKVGFLPWMAPSTSSAIKGLGKQGHKCVPPPAHLHLPYRLLDVTGVTIAFSL